MEELKVHRQGELVFIKIELPKGVEKQTYLKEMGTNCIREGEVTGHKHESFGGKLWDIIKRGFSFNKKNDDGSNSNQQGWFQIPEGQMIVSSENRIEIRHPEHKTLMLEPGDYLIRIQREYDEGQERFVRD